MDNSKIVRCMNGHHFKYTERIRITGKDMEHYAPCQGRCPICQTTEFTFIGEGINVYSIRGGNDNAFMEKYD